MSMKFQNEGMLTNEIKFNFYLKSWNMLKWSLLSISQQKRQSLVMNNGFLKGFKKKKLNQGIF